MCDSAFDRILQQLSRNSALSADQLRKTMELTMEEAMQNPDPAVQAMWRSIPRKGQKLTLEEFMDYLVEQKLLKP